MLRVRLLAAASMLLSGCGYNKLQHQDEAVKAAWSEVREPVPAARGPDSEPRRDREGLRHAGSSSVLIGVTEARAKAASIQLTPELINDPEAFAKFQAAQGELTQALKSLLAVTEDYPDLKSDANFRDLQAQLEGTENRITVARNRYIDAVQALQRDGARSSRRISRPSMFDFEVKPNFTVENEAAISTRRRQWIFGTARAGGARRSRQPTARRRRPPAPAN